MMRSKDEVITLISRIPKEKDEDGFISGNDEKEVDIFAEVGRPVRDEYYAALKDGIKATLSVTIDGNDFDLADQTKTVDGETFAKKAEFIRYREKEYRIERSFQVNEDDLQLTCSEVE